MRAKTRSSRTRLAPIIGASLTDVRVGDWAIVSNMKRLEAIVDRLPEAVRVDIEAWGGEPTFRVNGRNFVFTDVKATGISVKLPKDEAEAVVASDAGAEPTGYGLGRHGWVSVRLGAKPTAARWREVEEWVRTSYTMVAPKRLAKLVLEEDAG
jgi:predicted DNA-binding protein (MmcQ/YjbR family)